MSTKKQFPVLLGVNLVENDSDYRLKVDISRFNATTVNVSAWEDSLVIEMESAAHESGQSYYLGELQPEKYRRIIPLGFDLDNANVQTRKRHGILEITVRKADASSVKKQTSLKAVS